MQQFIDYQTLEFLIIIRTSPASHTTCLVTSLATGLASCLAACLSRCLPAHLPASRACLPRYRPPMPPGLVQGRPGLPLRARAPAPRSLILPRQPERHPQPHPRPRTHPRRHPPLPTHAASHAVQVAPARAGLGPWPAARPRAPAPRGGRGCGPPGAVVPGPQPGPVGGVELERVRVRGAGCAQVGGVAAWGLDDLVSGRQGVPTRDAQVGGQCACVCVCVEVGVP